MRDIISLAVMTAGSRLYGSDIPGSDHDYTGLHLPSCRGILIGKPEDTVQRGTKASELPSAGGIGSAKVRAARPGDVDHESHSLGKFLGMLKSSSMIAVEMLFVPEFEVQTRSEIWDTLVTQRHRLVSRDCRSFVGYAKTQADMYGRKATRLEECKAAYALLSEIAERKGLAMPLGEAEEAINALCLTADHLRVVTLLSGHTPDLKHLEVCSKNIAFTQPISTALKVISGRILSYGKRAQAARDGGDTKSLMHAIRIANQAIELLETGHITFPRPEAARLREIRLGQHDRFKIGQELDQLLEHIEAISQRSALPETIDEAWVDDLHFSAYRSQVMSQ